MLFYSTLFVIRLTLQRSVLSLLPSALVTSRLDYANFVLYGIPAKYISRLQRTQNTFARVVAGNRTPGSHLATLSKLHCHFTIVLNSNLPQ